MPGITKSAENRCSFRRRAFSFGSARSAFKAYLQYIGMSSEDEVLLPAYVGWSAREGSGVFDPILELNLGYSFYRMSSRLQIDVEDVKEKIRSRRPRLLLLIHYFGFPDPKLQELCDFAHANNVLVLEDEAHAMLSDRVGGICGRAGDAAIYSLHKLLPSASGGSLVLNSCRIDGDRDYLRSAAADTTSIDEDYDLFGIARRRRNNADCLLEALNRSNLPLEPLYAEVPEGVVPQTLPVMIKSGSRDDLYFQMNSAGYGVVSLYHTLVRTIHADEFPEAYALSRRIMNLPVHQDTEPAALSQMVDCLARFLQA